MDTLEHLRRLLADPTRPRTATLVQAAVVVALLPTPSGLEVLFEQRPRRLRRSPGEVSFPGGRVEAEESPQAAALRELEEELGVPAAEVEVLGQLDPRERRRGEFVYPFVCALSPGVVLRPQPEEVEEVFSIPLDTLRGLRMGRARIIEEYTLSPEFPSQYLPGGRWQRRQERPVYFFRHERFFVWGLTAEILRQLLGLLDPSG